MWGCRGTVTKLGVHGLPDISSLFGVLSCDEMDMCNPPDLDIVVHAHLQWDESCRQQLLRAGATVQTSSLQPIYSFRAQLPLRLLGGISLHNCHSRPCRIACTMVV
jgi:hypothetical protein